jgi:hypothetical protein
LKYYHLCKTSFISLMKTINIIVQTALCAAILGACSANKNTKDMNTLSFNEEQAAAMTAISCHEARGDQSSLAIAIGAGLEAGLTGNSSPSVR